MSWLVASPFIYLPVTSKLFVRSKLDKTKFAFNMTLTIRGELFPLPGMISCRSDEVCQQRQAVFQSLSESSTRLVSLRQREAKSGHKVVSQSSFLQSLTLMSICSGAVDGLLMSENPLVFDHPLSGGLQSWISL